MKTLLLVYLFLVSILLSQTGVEGRKLRRRLQFYIFSIFKGIQCHYCGVKDLCQVPYYEDEAEFITCPVSCMTFQGSDEHPDNVIQWGLTNIFFRFSKSGQKIIVRDCGFFEADECTANKMYENTDAKGTLCHCLTDKCNSAFSLRSFSFLTFTLLAIVLTI